MRMRTSAAQLLATIARRWKPGRFVQGDGSGLVPVDVHGEDANRDHPTRVTTTHPPPDEREATGQEQPRAIPRLPTERHHMTDHATQAANKELIRRYTNEVFNAHKPDLATEFLAPKAVWHGGTLGTVKGRDNIVGLLRGFIGALPDLNAVEQEMVAEGDTVMVRFVVDATHDGDLVGIPATGRPVRWDAVDVYHVTDGRIVEEWAADDLLAILHDIGFVTPPWLAAVPIA